MDCKISLVQEDSFYLILTYESGQSMPHLKVCFPFSPEDKIEKYQQAREFGKEMEKNLKIPLEILAN
jgi:hypothetical protein